MKPIFFRKFFFGENVAQEPAQLLAETWCPYPLWVSRNLPHKFEKLAHVTKSAKKKRHHMGNLAPLVPQTDADRETMSSALRKRQGYYDRREQNRSRYHTLAGTRQRRNKTNRIR